MIKKLSEREYWNFKTSWRRKRADSNSSKCINQTYWFKNDQYSLSLLFLGTLLAFFLFRFFFLFGTFILFKAIFLLHLTFLQSHLKLLLWLTFFGVFLNFLLDFLQFFIITLISVNKSEWPFPDGLLHILNFFGIGDIDQVLELPSLWEISLIFFSKIIDY